MTITLLGFDDKAPRGGDAVMVPIGHTFDILPERIKHVMEILLPGIRPVRRVGLVRQQRTGKPR
jgi:hypothetical protein